MFLRILTMLFAFVAIILLVTLALANRHDVQLVLDPFRPEAPALDVTMPFFFYLFGTLALGVFLGGMAVWMNQGRWRKTARQRTQEAIRWKAEVDRLTRERDSHVAAARQLTATTPGRSTAPSEAGKPLAIAGH